LCDWIRVSENQVFLKVKNRKWSLKPLKKQRKTETGIKLYRTLYTQFLNGRACKGNQVSQSIICTAIRTVKVYFL